MAKLHAVLWKYRKWLLPGLAVLFVGSVAGFVFFAAKLGYFVADKVTENTPTPAQHTAQPQHTPAPTLAPTLQPQVMADRRLLFDRLDFYALQTGVFADAQAASAEAEAQQALGAAGYVYEDVRYRVLASLYRTREDAGAVKERLEAQGVDCYIYTGCVGAMEITVSGPQELSSAMEAAYRLWCDTITAQGELCDLLEMEGIDVPSVCALLLQQAKDLDAQAQLLHPAQEVRDDLGVLAGLYDLLEVTRADTEKLAAQNDLEALAFLSKLRYNYIACVLYYRDYIEGISQKYAPAGSVLP